MKRILLFLLILSIAVISCKTKKTVTKETSYIPPSAQTSQQKPEEATAVPDQGDEDPILVKTENVTVVDNEDQSKEGYAFYVIIGSFSKPENAGKFKEELKGKGFAPYLLKSETGFTRVAIGQSDSEKDARALVMKIRNEHSEYNDVWLLKKK